jgi:hypothetical protein
VIDSRPSNSSIEQFLVNTGLFSQELIIHYYNHQYIIQPQILLHKTGQGKDLFRAFILLHRLLYLLQQQSNQGQTTSFESYLAQCLVDATAFEYDHGDDIVTLLEKSGWDMHRYAFGSLRIRVEW